MKRRKKHDLVKAVCRNCNTPLHSRYCHNCGQDLFAGMERTVFQAISEMLGNTFAWDNKIWSSLLYLMFFPGKLTKEYLAGRIAPYVSPYKLFWFVSILLFAVLSFRIGSILNKTLSDRESGTGTELNIRLSKNTTSKEVLLNPDAVEPVQPKTPTLNSDDNKDDIEQLKLFFQILKDFTGAYMPYIMFLLFPFFALLMYMFFKKKQPFYTQNLVFSVHIHAFLYIYFTLLILAFYVLPPFSSRSLNWILVLWPIIYILRSLRVVYKPRLRTMFWKIPLIILMYFLAFLIIVIPTLVVVIQSKGFFDE